MSDNPARDRIDHVFRHHDLQPVDIVANERIRAAGHMMAEVVLDCCPPGSDRNEAIKRIREAVMWANSSIACREDVIQGPFPPPPDDLYTP